ncbi:ABC transporter [Colletotrichum tofieldiae]|nr:ABC transporter [Colletotrichum tofieldiae]GKT68904.1 ABC transporter [Colletotrichum tofieldiae]
MKELGWWPWVRKFSIFWKFVWPVGQPKKEIVAIALVFVTILNKASALLYSYYFGCLVTELSEALKRSELRRAELLPPILMFVIAYGSTIALPILRSILYMNIKLYRELKLTTAIHEKIMNLGFSFHNIVNSADKIRIASDSQGLLNALDIVFIVLAPNLILVMASITFLVRKHGPLMAFVLLWFVVCYFLVQRRSFQRLPAEMNHYTTLRRKMDKDGHQNILCWETIEGHGKTTAAIERYYSGVASWVKQWFRWLNTCYVGQCSTGMVLILVFIFGLLLVLNDIFDKKATEGDFVAFISYWNNIVMSLDNFKDSNTDIMEKLFQATPGRRLLEMQPQVKGSRKFEFRAGEICFKDVTCYYEQKPEPVLENLNLHIAAGTKLTIIGESGSGKSTILRLLLGFLQPRSGHIHVDDQDTEDIDSTSLRSRIGYVGPTASLFRGSVMNNILYANQNATEEQVYEACQKACIHDDIKELSNGYATEIEDYEQAFSSGQLQRLRIARLFIKNPDIVVLDEATSALDVKTKASVQKAICKDFQDKTVIWVE